MSTNFGNLRLYLWGALGLLLFYNYEAWMKDYGASPQTTTSAAAANSGSYGRSPQPTSSRRPPPISCASSHVSKGRRTAYCTEVRRGFSRGFAKAPSYTRV